MRTPLRLAFLAGAVLAGVTCTDAPTAPLPPASTTARVALAPSFTDRAIQAWRSLAAFNLEANNVRVVIRRPGPPAVILKDTVVALAPGQVEIALELEVSILGTSEPLAAQVQVRDGDQVLFEGSTTVLAVRAGTPGGGTGGGTGALTVDYVGPGFRATALHITPRDPVVAPGTTIAFSALAFDASDLRVPDAVIAWATGDSTLATIDRTTGAFTAGSRRGTLRVIARLPSAIADSVIVRIVPPAQRVVTIAGGAQSALAGEALAEPFVVEVQAADGLPVPGVTVTFAASDDASISPATAVTSDSGRATAAMTLGHAAGSYTFTATAAGIGTTSVTATATPAPAAAIAVLAGDGQSGAVGTAAAQPLVVRVSDRFGTPVAGASVAWRATRGTLGSATSTTAADGTASNAYTFGDSLGAATVTATVTTSGGTAGTAGTASASFTLTATPATVAGLAIVSGDGQEGAPNAVLQPMVVRATDAAGNPAAGFTITWSTTDGAVDPTQSVTSADGTASALLTLGTTPGTVQVTAAAPASGTTPGASVIFTAATRSPAGPPANLVALNGPSFSYVAGVPVAQWPRVQVTDSAGVGVGGVQVDVSVLDPSDQLVEFSVLTAADGTANLHPAGETGFGTAGSYAMRITSPAVFESVIDYTVSVAPAALASLVAVTPPSATAALGVALAQQPVARATDAFGNGIAGVPVTAAIVAGGGTFTTASTTTVTTDAAGFATFTDLAFASGSGAQELAFTSGALVSTHQVVTILDAAPAITALSVSPAVMVFGGTGSFTATLANGTGAPYTGLILQGYILQGAQLQAAAGGTTLSCNGTGAAGELPVGGGCNATFSFTVPSQSVGLVGGAATYLLQLRDTAGVVLASASTPVTLSTTAPPAGTTRTWSGAVSRDWQDANNWSPVGVPTSTDRIWIPEPAPLYVAAGGAQAALYTGPITLSANAVVGEIHAVDYSVGLDVGAFQLEVTGAALDLGGSSITSSTGAGSVKLSGASPLLNVYDLPAMTVMNGARVAAGGDPWVNGNLDILGGTFALDGSSYLDVDGTLHLQGASAALGMGGNVEVGSSVYVYGDLVAEGAASDTTLLGGYLHVEGSVIQRSTFSTRSFAPQSGVYVSLQPSADARVSFASPDSKFAYLDIAPGYAAAALRAPDAAVARPLPPRVAAMRSALARSAAAAPARVRTRRATRQAGIASGVAALVVNPGVNFETSAAITDYLYLDGAVAVVNSGTTVTVPDMYVDDNAAFDIPAGAAFTVTASCTYSLYAQQVPAGICPNPQLLASSIAATAPGSDVFGVAGGSPAPAPAGWGVKLLRVDGLTPASGEGVTFNLGANEGNACTMTTPAVVTTDTNGVAALPLSLSGTSGSCVVHASTDNGLYQELRVYAVPGPSNAYKVYFGGAGGAWSNAGNWYDLAADSVTTAPQPGDRVFISYAGTSRATPTLDAPATVGVVRLGDIGTLSVAGYTLTVTDSITGGTVEGTSTGRLLLTGTNQVFGSSINGPVLAFGDAGCTGSSFRLEGSPPVVGDVQVNCPLDLTGTVLSVTGNFSTAGNGALTMDAPAGLYVTGNATFGGAAGSIAGGSFIFGGNLTATGASSLVIPAAATVRVSSTTATQAITLPATANSNALGALYVDNRFGVQFAGTGSVPANLYLYGAGASADATKVTIQSGASLAVGTQVDVNPFATLTVDGALSTPILSVAPNGTVVANGPITGVNSCVAVTGQVTGSGKPATCP